jgi:hypothetical protein
MGTLLGFALGFYLGAKAGPDGIDELTKAWQTISESEDFQALSASAKATVESLMQQGGASVGKLVATLMGAGVEFGSDHHETAGKNGNLQGLWGAVTQSAEGQSLVSAGAALLTQLLEQGLSGARGRI